MEKLHKLNNLFAVLKQTGKTVRYGDILRAGYSVITLDNMIQDFRVELRTDEEGYTIIAF